MERNMGLALKNTKRSGTEQTDKETSDEVSYVCQAQFSIRRHESMLGTSIIILAPSKLIAWFSNGI